MTSATLAAEYTRGSKAQPPRLTLTTIAGGRRHTVASMPVVGVREARAIAAERGAQPWNF